MNNHPRSAPFVLLVESDEPGTEPLAATLEAEGYRVRTAAGVQMAYRYFSEGVSSGLEMPDLVLLSDLTHPSCVVSFLEMTDTLGELAPIIILCTTLTGSELEHLPRRIRAVAILVNPMNKETMLKTVGIALHTVRRRRTGPLDFQAGGQLEDQEDEPSE
jgi:DNA-binding response OmpR family regulator